MFSEYNNLLVLAAHADDEAIGVLGSLYEFRGAIALVFLTDGAPPARWRPGSVSRAIYRRLRRCEACEVWRRLRPQAQLHFAPFADQRLGFCLDEAAAWLQPIVAATRPAALLTPAFEGGHPDHDAANVLASAITVETAIPVWEYALYTARAGVVRQLEFPGQPQWRVRLSAAATAAKRAALAEYRSQAQTLSLFSCGCEALRPLPRHDYRHPALPEPAVYELWGFPDSAQQMARHFTKFLEARTLSCAS